PRNRPLPLSSAQQRLWFLHQLAPQSSAYNVPAAIRLTGTLDLAALSTSLATIVQRHEILRTIFVLDNGVPMQVVVAAQPLVPTYLDLSTLPATEQDAELHRLAFTTARQAFDLAQGPLLRVNLLCLSNNDHVLLMTLHHIICDGWSTGIFVRELAALYAAALRGEDADLPPLPIQYADYAVWQQEWLEGEQSMQQLAYWKQQLREIPAMLPLPVDRPRPAVQTFRGAVYPFEISPQLTEALRALELREGATTFMILLALFNVLLARYTQQKEIVVGSPTANRNRSEVEHLIGFFVNSLVLRTDLSGNPTFRQMLQRVRETVLQATDHQDLPFEHLVAALQPRRDPSRTPLFQVLFDLQTGLTSSLQLPGLEIQPLTTTNATAKFDLSLIIEETPRNLIGAIEYSTDLFNVETISRLALHYKRLLEEVVANPDQRINWLTLLPAAEQNQLLTTWNAPSMIHSHNGGLHSLFDIQASRNPEAIAVSFQDQHLTYQELLRRSNQLAYFLQSCEIGPEVRVGICADRSLELIVGLLGILKAGGAYVPLDPDYSADRLAFQLADAQIPLVLTQQRYAARFSTHQVKLIHMDTDWPLIARQPAIHPPDRTTPENIAYIIYTSDSFDALKGAMNTHQAIINRLLWMQEAYCLTAQDRVLQKASFSFDVSVWEFFWPLIAGARLIMAGVSGHQDNRYLIEAITEQDVTRLHFVPSLLRTFLEEPGIHRCTSLRQVISSEETLSYPLQERFFARLNAALDNLYGPSEAAIDVSAWRCLPDDPRQTVPIGRPIANTSCYVLDAYGQLVPIGVAGELYIAGVQLARGYIGRPDLTAEQFVPDHISGTAGARLYRTGDLVRWRSDGTLEYLRRLDYQVNLRGFLVEPGEIEVALREHPSIRDAVVLAQQITSDDTRLVAYLVTEDAEALPASTLRTFLLDKLPAYMVPSSFLTLPSLPLTPNGKVDRRALLALKAPPAEGMAAYQPPQTLLEQQIATIWQEVLGVERVGMHDNFFDLGGHSLLLTRVHQRLLEVVAQPLSLIDLFQYPTISALSVHLAKRSQETLVFVQSQRRAASRRASMTRLRTQHDKRKR
ncbi:MAG TPA: amino acid adenylation domain-containing protein, partial [Ktedonobacteraceae bacterium]|nr:amino acid adenylation domain-containing protein [Ktedonobacteraceae bacterium]